MLCICLSKENESKERTLLRGIFNLRLKPSEKLCGLCPEFQSFFRLFCVKELQSVALLNNYLHYSEIQKSHLIFILIIGTINILHIEINL